MPELRATRIRTWEPRDLHTVEALLKLLSQDASVTSEDAPTYVAERDGQVVGMVTLCVFTTLTGPKAYLDHLVVAPHARGDGIYRSLGFSERDTTSFRLTLD